MSATGAPHPPGPPSAAAAGAGALPPPAARLALFRLGRRLCGVASSSCKQFVHLDAVTPVPLAPAPLLGVTQLRGRIVPVIDAAPLLPPPPGNGGVLAASAWPVAGAPPPPGEDAMPALVVTVTGLDSTLAALRVTEIVGFEHPSPPLSAGGPPRWQDEDVAVLDVAALVAGVARLLAAAPRPAPAGEPGWPPRQEVAQR